MYVVFVQLLLLRSVPVLHSASNTMDSAVTIMRISHSMLAPLQLSAAERNSTFSPVTSCLSVGARYEKFTTDVCQVQLLRANDLEFLVDFCEELWPQPLHDPYRCPIRIPTCRPMLHPYSMEHQSSSAPHNQGVTVGAPDPEACFESLALLQSAFTCKGLPV